MKFIAHKGKPCTPPIVHGIEFAPHHDEVHFLAKVEDGHAALQHFTGHPSYRIVDSVDDVAEAFAGPAPELVPAGTDLDALIKSTGLPTKVQALETANAELRAENDALRSKVEALQGELEAAKAGGDESDDIEQLKAEINVLETKKGQEGKLSFNENMKLGKLQAKLEKLTK